MAGGLPQLIGVSWACESGASTADGLTTTGLTLPKTIRFSPENSSRKPLEISDEIEVSGETRGPVGPVGQAVAVRIDGDQVAFINCRFSGNQDTLYPHGEKSHQYYRDCIIEGTVDFIFGWSTVVFDRCSLICKDQGFVTAPSTNEGTAFGFVFLDCKISGTASEGSFYLGRPWRPFAKSVFLRCELGNLIKPEGWHNWDKPDAEKTSFFAEYQNTGSGASVDKRVSWSHQLTSEEASAYTPENILGEWVRKYK